MAIQKNGEQISQPAHHVHTGLFAIIGLLILIAIGLGGWFYYREQNWSSTFTQITEEKAALQKQVEVYQSNKYTGPYGLLSYIKYTQAQSVSSLDPESLVMQYPEASCSSLTEADGETSEVALLTTHFGSPAMLGAEVFTGLPAADQADIKTLIDSQLTFIKDGAKEKSPVYSLHKVCVMDADHILMLAVDIENSAFRVPLSFTRYDGAWKLQAMPPMLNLFAATTSVRVHPDGSPILVDIYKNASIAAWQAYYLDTQHQVIDTIESCRIVKQDSQFVRMCERLYDQVL
jgi:hypothetical protein